MGTTPEIDLFEEVGQRLYAEVFGPGTDLHTTFAKDDMVEALRFAHGGAFEAHRGKLIKGYGIEPANVPDLISQIAAMDEYSFYAVGVCDERSAASQALRGRVAAFLTNMPDAFPGLCPADYLASHEAGLYAAVLLMEGNEQGAPVYRSVRIENDTPDLLDGKPVRSTKPTGQNQTWAVSMIVRRGLSLEAARSFQSDYERAEKAGEPRADDLIRASGFSSPATTETSTAAPEFP